MMEAILFAIILNNANFCIGSWRNQHFLSWVPDTFELPKVLIHREGKTGIRENDIGKVDNLGWLDPIQFNCETIAHLSS